MPPSECDTILIPINADVLLGGEQQRAVAAAHCTVEHGLPDRERSCKRVTEQVVLRGSTQSPVRPRQVMLGFIDPRGIEVGSWSDSTTARGADLVHAIRARSIRNDTLEAQDLVPHRQDRSLFFLSRVASRCLEPVLDDRLPGIQI